MRADEVGTQLSVTQSTLSLSGGDRRWLMRTGTPSAKQYAKELKEMSGKSYIIRELSQAAGAKKPSQSHKATALGAMKAAWDRKEEYYDPARREDILGSTKKPAWNCGKNISKTQLYLWQKRWNAWTISFGVGFWFVVCCCQSWWLQWPAVLWARRYCKRCGKALLGRRLALPGPMGRCAFSHIIQLWECAGGSTGHAASFSPSLSRRSRWLSRRQCRSSPLFLRKRSRRVR